MKISDAFVTLLREYSSRPLAQGLHREDAPIYSLGLKDGVTLLAQELLEQLKPEEESE
jgi:hypothetical protein